MDDILSLGWIRAMKWRCAEHSDQAGVLFCYAIHAKFLGMWKDT